MTGWIIGLSGIIFKTTNGGTTDIINTNNSFPDKFELSQNFPNPFNPSTKIRFSLPNSGNVSLKIYDLTGKEVANPVSGLISKGNYEINFDASLLSSGVYFYKLTSGNYVNTKKMTIVK